MHIAMSVKPDWSRAHPRATSPHEIHTACVCSPHYLFPPVARVMLVDFQRAAASIDLSLSNTETVIAHFHVHVAGSNRNNGRSSETIRSGASMQSRTSSSGENSSYMGN